MRVILLSSASSGYVHTYVYDPSDDAASPVAMETEATVLLFAGVMSGGGPKRDGGVLRRLAAWMGSTKEQAQC